MAIFATLVLMTAFIAVTFRYWNRLGEHLPEFDSRHYCLWAVKGMAVPILVWMSLNSGWVAGLPPLVPRLALAAPGTPLAQATLNVFLQISILAGSYWAATTLAWIAFTAAQLMPVSQRMEPIMSGVLWGLFFFPVAGWIGYAGGWAWAGLALLFLFGPLAHALLPCVRTRPPQPAYSAAEGKLKMGKYDEAEWEVIQQLEKKEDDFQGWIMLAEIYAVHYRDLPAADATIRELCAQPNVNISDYADALHKLADWHLRIGQDPEEARLALECICARLPGTHLDRMARQRIAQLPRSREELIKAKQGRTIRLPGVASVADDRAGLPGEKEMSREEAAGMAAGLVEDLRLNPDNTAAREQFARVLAERLNQPEAALEQLRLLLGMAEPSEDNRARWLLLSACWHLGYTRNFDEAKRMLEHLLERYPHSVQAFDAQRRLNLLAMEMRFRKAREQAQRANR